jgi:RNA recognition motif-containing protein
MIIFDKFSGKPRGFGFVTYTDSSSVERLMRDKNALFIRGKWIDCKVATPCGKKGEEEEAKGPEEMKISHGTQLE